jgi:hypothetical protein
MSPSSCKTRPLRNGWPPTGPTRYATPARTTSRRPGLSEPNSDGTTNSIFTGLVSEYRRDVNAVSAELLKVRNRISGGSYSPFGTADQAPSTRITGPSGMAVCGKPGTSVISVTQFGFSLWEFQVYGT